jgi:hypothetical protein
MTDEAGQESREQRQARIRRNNKRTATWLAGLALFFFVMLFAKRLWIH